MRNFKIICGLILWSISLTYGQNPGEFDTTFNAPRGYAWYSGNSTEANYRARTILPQSNGDNYVVGSAFLGSSAYYYFSILKYGSNGDLDASFGDDGEVRITNGNQIVARDAYQNGDKIVIVGTSYVADIGELMLVRINLDGSLDTTFGISGIITHDLTNRDDIGTAINPLENGKMVVVGSSKLANDYDALVARFHADGSLDTSFGDEGIVVSTIPPYRAIPSDIKVVAGGKILIAGTYDENLETRIFVVGYHPDGSLDKSFGDEGFVIIDYFPDRKVSFKSMETRNGKVLIAGRSSVGNGVSGDLFLTRYLSNGTLDTSFGTDGVEFHGNTTQNMDAGDLIFQPDGKFLIAGTIDENSTIWRYNANGILDTEFADQGVAFLPIDLISTTLNDIRFESGGKIVICGDASHEFFNNVWMITLRVISGLSLGVVDFNNLGNSVVVYPNPIADQTVLEFTIQDDKVLSLALYDMTGSLMRYIFQNESRSKGSHTETIEMKDVPSGNYFLKLSDGSTGYGIKILKK